MYFFPLLFSCSETPSKTQDTQNTIEMDTAEDTANMDADTAEDTAEEIPLDCSDLEVTVEWSESHLNLSFITYDELGSYYFGLAQTELASPNKWTGEDCHLGYSHEEQSFRYCHPARTGLTLSYGAAYSEVIEGFSTHFSGPEFESQVTYIIKEAISGCCWVWGGSPTYYQDLSCLPL